MATKKVIIKIDKYTHYDEDGLEIQFGEAPATAICRKCGLVMSVGDPCWKKQSNDGVDPVLFHENCVYVVPIEECY